MQSSLKVHIAWTSRFLTCEMRNKPCGSPQCLGKELSTGDRVPLPTTHSAFLFTLEKSTPKAAGKLNAYRDTISNLQFVPSQRTHEVTQFSKMTAKILGHGKDCHGADGACSWAKYKILIAVEMPNMKDVSHYIAFEKLTKSTDKERCFCVWTLTRWRKPNALLGKSRSKNNNT